MTEKVISHKSIAQNVRSTFKAISEIVKNFVINPSQNSLKILFYETL